MRNSYATQLYLLMIFLLLSVSLKSQILLQTINVIAKTDTTYGIDVSFYQGKINFNEIDTNIKFVIIKVSEGLNRIDPKFKYNWDNCNLIKGGYHFFRPQSSGNAQAKLFLSQLSIDSGNIRPVIDVEYTPYWNFKKNRKIGVKNLRQMITYIREYCGVEPIIYTSGHFWNTFISPYYEENHTLWVADYKNKKPNLPKNMSWIIWQFSCKGKITGIKTKVDMNICLNINKILVD